MYNDQSFTALSRLYGLFHEESEEASLACGPGCALCCTRNVTVTRLEAAYLLNHLSPETRAHLKERLLSQQKEKRMQPITTWNGLAALCMAGTEAPEEISDPDWWPCPLLDPTTRHCTVYAVRPLACRVMTSRSLCDTAQAADMPENRVVRNTVFQQFVEHMDAAGESGNLMDLLLDGLGETASCNGCIPNRKMPMLMVPPHLQQEFRPLILALSRLLSGPA